MRWPTVTALLICLTALSSRAGSLELFGLRHFSIDTDIFANQAGGLTVNDLSLAGDAGVATELGEADSGAFFFPDAYSVSEGYFMVANAYGSVDGIGDSLIGSVRGRRGDYATFYATADYSAIGATSITCQVWSGNLLIQESTVSTGEVTMYAEYGGRPRVNPWWKQANGEFGASIEFTSFIPIALTSCVENCPFVYGGNRIFIRPNGATGIVHHVSRTDVFGGGGLSEFLYNNVQLGMFARPHSALGSARLVATNGVLKLDELAGDLENPAGVLVEFDHAAAANIQLLPLEIAVPNTNAMQERVNISVSGSWNNYVQFIGAATLGNSNGLLQLSFTFDTSTNSIVIYSNSVPVGTNGSLRDDFISITGEPRLTSVSANAELLEARPGISLGFETPATFHFPDGSTAIGHRAFLSSPLVNGVADITGVAIDTQLISSFTIVNETSTSFTPSLKITREGLNVRLEWADPARAYRLQARQNFEDGFDNLELTISYQDGIATAVYNMAEDGPSLGEAGNRFFRLFRYTNPY